MDQVELFTANIILIDLTSKFYYNNFEEINHKNKIFTIFNTNKIQLYLVVYNIYVYRIECNCFSAMFAI